MSLTDKSTEIVEKILKTKKYSNVCPELVERIVTSEEKKYKNYKDISKSTKKKLYQIYSVYTNERYLKEMHNLIEKLSLYQAETDLINICNEILLRHVSTKERIGYYEEFYDRIFEVTGYPKVIIDIACGNNPFSVFYMNSKNIEVYDALDVNRQNINFINKFAEIIGLNINGVAIDIMQYSFENKYYDIGFVLKFLPVLEMQNSGSSLNFLKKLRCKHIVVSFPTRSISGAKKGMDNYYETWFKKVIYGSFEIFNEYKYSNEMVFIIKEL